MADTRTLKLSLLADVKKFTDGMNRADDDTKKLESNLKTNGKKMAKSIGLVVTAVGVMATAFGVDAVKAYAEDEASQEKFRTTLKNTAGVIDETVIDSINDFIERMQFASGFSDGELRDSLGRLTRSTTDVSDAQDILTVAMDTARGTGKNLGDVSDILAKAVDGNYTPLKKMGVKLDENTIKTKDFDGVLSTLTDLFGGQATTYADTFQGKLDIVNQRFGELKESAGAKLLGPLGTLLEVVNDVAKGFAGEDPQSLSNRARELAGNFAGTGGTSLGGSLKTLADAFTKLFDALLGDGTDSSDILVTFAKALENVAGGINAIADAVKSAKKIGGKIIDTFVMGEGKSGFASFIPGIPGGASGTGGGSRAAGGAVSGNQPFRVGEFGPEMFIPSGSGSIRPDNGAGQGVTIIMNGVIDGESARRSIERLLQDSSRRTGAINLVGATL